MYLNIGIGLYNKIGGGEQKDIRGLDCHSLDRGWEVVGEWTIKLKSYVHSNKVLTIGYRLTFR